MAATQTRALINTQSHDFKLNECITFAHANWETQSPENLEIKRVLGLYRYNFSRVRQTMIVPAQVGAMAFDIQRWRNQAEVELFGTMNGERTAEQWSNVQDCMVELSKKELEPVLKKHGTPEWDKHVLQRLESGMTAVNAVASADAAGLAINGILASYITGAWTAFEAMATDLWVTALNISPSRLAALNGKAILFNKAARASDTDSIGDPQNRESKSVTLSLVQKHGFDLRASMGTILRTQFDFGRLAGIRKAYGSAFDKAYENIRAALLDDSLDALSAVRNLLVHKAGIPDEEYARRTKGMKVPTSEIGPIMLDGKTVVDLIGPVRDQGAKLISAVDEWLKTHG